MDNYTALVIPLNRFAEEIQCFRKQHVHMPAVDMPPHVSILYPFLPLPEIDATVDRKIRDILQSSFPFEYSLAGFDVFESAEVLYLKPEPEGPFIELFESLKRTFPGLQPAFDPPKMHLTLSHREGSKDFDALKDELAEITLPFTATADTLELYEKSNGRWAKIKDYKGTSDEHD